jgi:hypothetical protein
MNSSHVPPTHAAHPAWRLINTRCASVSATPQATCATRNSQIGAKKYANGTTRKPYPSLLLDTSMQCTNEKTA